MARSYRSGIEQRTASGNWFGVSAYAPDWYFVMPSGAIITMSLQGGYTPYNPDYEGLFNAIAVKYLRVEIGGAKLWETWSGEIPPDAVIESIA